MSEFVELIKLEYITLEQFIPNWTEIIKEMDEYKIPSLGCRRIKYAENKGLSFNSYKYCLVGEGYKNDDIYLRTYCSYCSEAALNSASSALAEGKETFQNFKLDLFTHMLETHSELMIKHG